HELLHFLGVRTGSTTSHNNAYFSPTPDTIVFVDMSLLNFPKAKTLLRSKKDKINRVILYLTHLHADHASGVVPLAIYIKNLFKNKILLEVISSPEVARAASIALTLEGGKMTFDSETKMMDEVLRFYSITDKGAFCYFEGVDVEAESLRFKYPWFHGEIIPTKHDARLTGACGFRFDFWKTTVFYSGDTNTLEPFSPRIQEYCDTAINKEVWFYVETRVNDSKRHLQWEKIRLELSLLHQFIGKRFHVVLMHYNQPGIIIPDLLELNKDRHWIELAESEVIST
ncbi:hypothetical protein IJH89_01590, partial [Candidatus Saccharibacteria bacterium]|nr:hypothetical protein [Candidatus Saccharibacteria bacterium]